MRDEISQRRREAEKSIVTLSSAKPFTSAVTTELPASSEFMQRVQTAYDVLESNGFEVKEATYQQSVSKTDKLQRLTVELPMTGQYPSLRMALAALMEQPGLDVESVSMERKNIADETLTMRIRFSLLGVSE
jgi:hypothetical protein